MEMLGIAGLCCMFLFLVGGGIASIVWRKKSRPFALGCLLPCAVVFLLAAGGMGKYLLLDEPLYMAASVGDVRKVNRLLAWGANANSDFEGHSALNAAVEANHAEIVRILIQHGANVAVQDPWAGHTPLQTAQIHGYAEIKRLLLQAGATK